MNRILFHQFSEAGLGRTSLGRAIATQAQEQGFFNSTGTGANLKRSFTARIPNAAICNGALSGGYRTTLNTETGTDLIAIKDLPGITVPDRRRTYLFERLRKVPIAGNSLRFLRETSFTNAATAVAEGAEKPEATLVLEQVTGLVEKVAVWTKVTEEMLADFPISESYINGALAAMVLQKTDQDCITGDGLSNTQLGLLNVVGIQTQSCTGLALPHDAFMKAFTKLRTIGNTEPDVVIVNPDDWQNLKLTRDNTGQPLDGNAFGLLYGHPVPTGPVPTIWGVETIVTSAMTQGTALACSLGNACTWYAHGDLKIDASNSDDDNFTKNLVTVRAEHRGLLAAFKPLAICSITNIPS